MKISENLRDAVEEFVAAKSLKQIQTPMPSKGLVTVEYRYNLCYNPKVTDKVFIVSEIMKYQSHSLSDKKYGIYAFDVKTAKELKNFSDSDECYFGIVNDLRVIEKLL
jgi:hypothetical protein